MAVVLLPPRGRAPRPGTLRPLRRRSRGLNDAAFVDFLWGDDLSDLLPPFTAVDDLYAAVADGEGELGSAPAGVAEASGLPAAVDDHRLELSDGGSGDDERPRKRARTSEGARSNPVGRPTRFRRAVVRALRNLEALNEGQPDQPGDNLLYNNLRQGEFADLARDLAGAGVAWDRAFFTGRFPGGVDVEDAARATVARVADALGDERRVRVRVAWSAWRSSVVRRRQAGNGGPFRLQGG